MGVFTEFTALLRAMPGESKAVALSLLAVEKGLRIAETFISTQAAAQRALAELPYPANLAMAAKVEAIGKVRMGLIAATGLVEAATMGGGSSGSLSVSAGSSAEAGMTAPQQGPAEPEMRPVDLRIQIDSRRNLFGREEVEQILVGINDLLKDGAQIGSIRVS